MSVVAFTTSAWQRDWPVVLDPVRYRMILESHRHPFATRLVVLNNFDSEREADRAHTAAQRLVELELATDVIRSRVTLDAQTLARFGLGDEFWEKNPWFSAAHLAALAYLEGRAEFQFYMSGDVWLARACEWVERAVCALASEPQVLGLNLCRNIYRQDFYSRHCHRESDALWISEPNYVPTPEKPAGFSLSDLAYLIPVRPSGGWQFTLRAEALAPWLTGWPAYARPCFEMLYRMALAARGMCHAALKPLPGGGPITQHKNIPGGTGFKRWLYRCLGHYRPGGKYAPQLH